MTSTRYDKIGHGYARTRREDPRLAALIHAALGDARTVVNVGAGAGSYEPADRYVLAIEPSDAMAAQRGPDRVPAIRASAGALPLRDRSVDAAMAILTVHHWDAEQEAGIRELRRVARGPVVILTYDAAVANEMWLVKDYFPEVGALDARTMPPIDRVVSLLGGADVSVVPIPRDTIDWHLGSFWAHPERVLDPEARAATSGFARADPAVVTRVVTAVQRDLDDGTWETRHGALRTLADYDAGLRLISSSGASPPTPPPQTRPAKTRVASQPLARSLLGPRHSLTPLSGS
ncbi:MAG: class I SAM-dependent methyltransferase [Labilithrix sp.]|nr:class I SAM-dependent methyltransferase [Labilithrix sp.]MCW5813963.1 class I SAM-dependent methyltransferase [Labilithrix sp.]